MVTPALALAVLAIHHNMEQGVWQGGTLSPFLYCNFVDELLDTLTTSGLGVSINGLYIIVVC